MRFTLPLASLCSLRRLLAVTGLVLLSATAPTFAATLYVDDRNDGQIGDGTFANPYRNLQTAINRAASGDTLFIHLGRYVATRNSFTDPTCGNCEEDFHQPIPATYGFRITGKSLILQGESRQGTVLVTNAGYGVLFENAGASRVENLTVTGGLRDTDGKATNGAIVGRYTNLTVRNADLRDNVGLITGLDPGVSGIVMREGGVLTAENLLIYKTTWDGIVLYRSDPDVPGSAARATIRNVHIEQGDGVAIGATGDSQADITNARISHYAKGVGSFGTAQVTLRNSILTYQWGWGVSSDDTSSMTAINNVVAYTEWMGLAQMLPSARVTFINNIVHANGWGTGEGWPAVGISLANTYLATVKYNNTYNNSYNNYCDPFGCGPVAVSSGPTTGNITGNIAADSLFINPAAGNFSLPCNSPAINAGDLSIFDLDGTRSDMGAYGGPASPQQPPVCSVADLLPTPITYPTATYEAGNVINFDSGVRNAGPVGTGTFNVKWFVNGTQLGHGGHVGVPANSTVMNGNSQFAWTATQGTHTITFAVDTSSFIPESYEGNNSTSVNVTVVAPRADLTPTAINYNPADLVAGRQILFDSGVQNLKNVPTGNFHIKWFVNNTQVGYGVHTGVAGNATVLNENSAYRWTATSGTHTIRFVLDVDNHVTESNEANNSRSITVTVP